MKKIRIGVAGEALALGLEIKIQDNDFEYLTKVMRQKIGDQIFLFDGCNGEFRSVVSKMEKKFLVLRIKEKISDLKKVPNITLAFAPVKNVRLDFIAAKATELGAAYFQPIITRRTIIDKINLKRFQANIKEACEQCLRNDFPKVFKIKKLEDFLSSEEISEQILIFCDESGQGLKASKILQEIATRIKNEGEKGVVIFIGPEGGFSDEEFLKMRSLPNLYSLNLGPRILRADTAIVSALTLVQEFLGDF